MKPSIELIRICAIVVITLTHTRNSLEEGVIHFIVEELPNYGTALMAVLSGFLFFTMSRSHQGLFTNKIKSLAIPYLIANISVLALVLIAYYGLGYNSLNRLSYDITLLTQGILSLDEVPINPPSYFVRDLFVIFTFLALVIHRDYRTLLVLIPLGLFGTFFLRWDIVLLFGLGALFAFIKDRVNRNSLLLTLGTLTLVSGFWFPDHLRFPSSLFVFALIIDMDIKFINVGRYSYLLYLYHSPIMVVSYPILSRFIHNQYINISIQIILPMILIMGLVLLSRRYQWLKVLSGGR